MGTLTATLTNPTNPVLAVSWKDLLNYQLFVVNSLTGRRVPLRRIALANNSFSIKLSQFKRTHRLLNGTYYLSAVSLTKSVSSQSFAIEDLPVSVTALLQGSLLTVTIANPEEIDPEPEPGVYATLFLVHSTETTKMFSSLMYATKQPSQIFPEVSTYTLTDLTFLDGTPLVNGSYIAQIYFGNKPQYTASDPFYYNITGEWPLSEVLQVGNTASTDINLDGHNIYSNSLYNIKGDKGIVIGGTVDGTSPEDPNTTNVNIKARLNMGGYEIQDCPSIFTQIDEDAMYIQNFGTGGLQLGYFTGPTNIVGTDINIGTTGETPGNVTLGGTDTTSVQLNSVFNTNGHEIKECIVISGTYTELDIVNKNSVTGNISIGATSNEGQPPGAIFFQSNLDMANHNIVGVGAPLLCSYTSLPTLVPSQVGYIQQGTGTTLAIGTDATLLRTLELGVGVWIIKARLYSYGNSSLTYATMFISDTDHYDDQNPVYNSQANSLVGYGYVAGSLTKYLTVTSGTILQYFLANSTPAITCNSVSFEAIRIA
jgi:hypothetical protein